MAIPAWHAAASVLLLCSVVNCKFTLSWLSPISLTQKRLQALSSKHFAAAGFHSSSFVPDGYAYIGHSSQTDALSSVVSKHESKLPASLPVRSTGYTAFVDLEAAKQGAGQQQRSSDQQHETLMFTREGHLYTKP